MKLSVGTRFADVETDNDLQSLIDNNLGGFDLIESESSQFLIDETIFAIYSKINADFGKWSFSGGLRYEDSNTEGLSIFMENNTIREEVQKRPIKKVFPSASLSSINRKQRSPHFDQYEYMLKGRRSLCFWRILKLVTPLITP